MDKQYGQHLIRFYPLKNCLRLTGLTNQTLRTWIKERVITCYKMHRMWVMCKAEQDALGAVVRKHHADTKHGVITPALRRDAIEALTAVRIALDTLARPKLELSEEQRQLIQISLQDRG